MNVIIGALHHQSSKLSLDHNWKPINADARNRMLSPQTRGVAIAMGKCVILPLCGLLATINIVQKRS